MHSWVFTQGLEKGREQTLRYQFERRLHRKLTTEEQASLRDRLLRLGPERLGAVVLDLSSEELAAWLANADAT